MSSTILLSRGSIQSDDIRFVAVGKSFNDSLNPIPRRLLDTLERDHAVLPI